MPSVPAQVQWHTITVSGFTSVVEQSIAEITQVIVVVIVYLSNSGMIAVINTSGFVSH